MSECPNVLVSQEAHTAWVRLNRMRGTTPRPEDVEDMKRWAATMQAGMRRCTGEHVIDGRGVRHTTADGEQWWDPTPEPETYGYDYDADPYDAMPTLANAIKRVETYIAEWGDGEPDEGLHTRDLAVLLEAAKREADRADTP